MAARIDNGRAQLLTRTGLDWTAKYPSVLAALANLTVSSAYLDGELCGVNEAGLPSFAQTQAATDGERGVQLVYYAFDLLHLEDWDISDLQLIERKALLEPMLKNKPGLQYNGHETGDGELILKHAGKLRNTPATRKARAYRLIAGSRRHFIRFPAWTVAQRSVRASYHIPHDEMGTVPHL